MRILIATKNKGKFGEIAGFLRGGVFDSVGEATAGFAGEGSARADFEVEFLGDYQVDDGDFTEDGVSHEENASKKARYYWEKFCGDDAGGDSGCVCGGASGDSGCVCGGVSGVVGVADAAGSFDFVLGEDSGIYVDALGDELGVQTRRWGAGEKATDKEWLEYFMKEMGVRAPLDSERGAKFVCCACLVRRVQGALIEEFFKGETFGKITREIADEVLPGLPLSSVFLPEGFDKVYAELGRDEKNKISHRGQAVGKVKRWLWNYSLPGKGISSG